METQPHYLPSEQIEVEESLIRSAREARVRGELDVIASSLFSILVLTGTVKIDLFTDKEDTTEKHYQISHSVSREENCFIQVELNPNFLPTENQDHTSLNGLTDLVLETVDLYRTLRSLGAKFEANL